MKSIISLFTILICSFSLSFGQSQADHWYFGGTAGLDFSSGSMMIDGNGHAQASHGSSCVSDTSGQLLFYTNGYKIWNKNHQIMANGVIADSLVGENTFQNCLIVPNPGNTDQYYVFSIDPVYKNDHGLGYRMVDMTLDNGNGEVVGTTSFLFDSLGPGCVATIHTNQRDYWLVVRSVAFEPRGVLHVLLIDSNGVHSYSSFDLNSHDLGHGTGKFSPNGRLLSWGSHLFDFNNTTGDLLNHRTFRQSHNHSEFSPNNRFLYATYSGSDALKLYQYDLAAPDIEASRITIDEPDKVYIKGGLQLAPDGKIYVSYLYNIGVIHHPDSQGLGCGLKQNYITLNSPSRWEFPNFPSNYFSFLSQKDTSVHVISASDVQVYPNPASEYINIIIKDFEGAIIEIIDGSFRQFYKEEIKKEATKVDVSSLAKGVYFVVVKKEGRETMHKFLVN